MQELLYKNLPCTQLRHEISEVQVAHGEKQSWHMDMLLEDIVL